MIYFTQGIIRLISFSIAILFLFSSSIRCLAPQSHAQKILQPTLQPISPPSSPTENTESPENLKDPENRKDSELNTETIKTWFTTKASESEEGLHLDSHSHSHSHNILESNIALCILIGLAIILFSFAIVHDALEEVINSGLFSTNIPIQVFSWLGLVGIPAVLIILFIIFPLIISFFKSIGSILHFIHSSALEAGQYQIKNFSAKYPINSSYFMTQLVLITFIIVPIAPYLLIIIPFLYFILFIAKDISLHDMSDSSFHAIQSKIEDFFKSFHFSGEDVEDIAKSIAYIFLIATIGIIHNLEFAIDMMILLLFIYLVFHVIHILMHKVSSSKIIQPTEIYQAIKSTPPTCILKKFGSDEINMEVKVTDLEKFISEHNIDLEKISIIVSFTITYDPTNSVYETPWVDGTIIDVPDLVEVSSYISTGSVTTTTKLTKNYEFFGGSQIIYKGHTNAEITLKLSGNCGFSSYFGQYHQGMTWDEEQYEGSLSTSLRVFPIIFYIILLILFVTVGVICDRVHLYQITIHAISFYLSIITLLTALSIGICITPFIFASGIIKIGYKQYLLGNHLVIKNNNIFSNSPPKFFGFDINGTLINHRSVENIKSLHEDTEQTRSTLARFGRAFKQSMVNFGNNYMEELIQLQPDKKNNSTTEIETAEFTGEYSHIKFSSQEDFYCGRIVFLKKKFPHLQEVLNNFEGENQEDLWCLYNEATAECIAVWNYNYRNVRDGLPQLMRTLKKKKIPVLLITGAPPKDLAVNEAVEKCSENHPNVFLFHSCTPPQKKALILKAFQIHGSKITTILEERIQERVQEKLLELQNSSPEDTPSTNTFPMEEYETELRKLGVSIDEFEELLKEHNLNVDTDDASPQKYSVAFMGDGPNDLSAFKQVGDWSLTEESSAFYLSNYQAKITLSSESLKHVIPILTVRRNFFLWLGVFLAVAFSLMIITGAALTFTGHHRILLAPIFHALSEGLLTIIFLALALMKVAYTIKKHRTKQVIDPQRKVNPITQDDRLKVSPPVSLSNFQQKKHLSPEEEKKLAQCA